jgi:hypothetical protein
MRCYVSLQHEIYPGPELCSLVWVSVNEIFDLCFLVNLEKHNLFTYLIWGCTEQKGNNFDELKSGGLHEK